MGEGCTAKIAPYLSTREARAGRNRKAPRSEKRVRKLPPGMASVPGVASAGSRPACAWDLLLGLGAGTGSGSSYAPGPQIPTGGSPARRGAHSLRGRP